MIVQCGWCSKPMGQKPPLEDKSVTTTICPSCMRKQVLKIESQSMEQAQGKLTERHK